MNRGMILLATDEQSIFFRIQKAERSLFQSSTKEEEKRIAVNKDEAFVIRLRAKNKEGIR